MDRHESPSQPSPKAFKFKYVAEEELLQIVRKVRREKQREKDALQWQRFVEDKERNLPSSTRHEDLPPCSCHHFEQVSIEKNEKTIEDYPKLEYDQASIPSEAQGPPLPLKHSEGGMTARESGVLQRIALLRHKIGLALDSIMGMIHCRPAEPDGPDDVARRKIRINEFLSRFSRNYLFQFRRQVADLRRHVVCASPYTLGRHTEYQALMQKLVSAHQTALQSLQAYLSQIPASLQGTNIFGKLRDLLHHLCDLCTLKHQLDNHAGFIAGCGDSEDRDDVFLKCKELLDILDEKSAEPEDSVSVSLPLSGRGSMNPRTQRLSHRVNGGLCQDSWKRTSAYLARAKFGAPSSVRSSVSPHASSSRGKHFHEEKTLKDMSLNQCDSELKEVLAHMHHVLCNKIVGMKRKKGRHYKCGLDSNLVGGCKSSGSQKPLNKVQNISKNVQLVITQHCDSDEEGYRDVATDTADLASDYKSEGENKRIKKVVWALNDPQYSEETKTALSEESSERTYVVTTHLSADESSNHGDNPMRPRNTSEQRLLNYKQRFHDYNCKSENPVIQRWCEDILSRAFQDISEDLEPSFLLEKMYHLEFKD